MFVPGTEFFSDIPLGTSATILSMFLVQSFESDLILSRSKYIKDSNFVRPSYVILSTDASEDDFIFTALFIHDWYCLFVTIGMLVSLPFWYNSLSLYIARL